MSEEEPLAEIPVDDGPNVEAAPAAPALLEAEDLTVARGGLDVIVALTLKVSGRRALLVGEAAPLIDLVLGQGVRAGREARRAPKGLHLRSGSLRCLGMDVATGQHLAHIGAAPLDPPLPAEWTSLDYLAWSARLAGVERRRAAELAAEVLASLGLAAFAKVRLPALPLAARRAVVLAQASLGEPSLIIAVDPLLGLDSAQHVAVLGVLGQVSDRRAALVATPSVDAGTTGALLAQAADAVVRLG